MPPTGCATRIQHELFSSFLPCRSQWNWTFTRPYLSVEICSPARPTTNAVCGPATTGLGVPPGGRNGTLAGMHVKEFVYSKPPEPCAGCVAVWRTLVSR